MFLLKLVFGFGAACIDLDSFCKRLQGTINIGITSDQHLNFLAIQVALAELMPATVMPASACRKYPINTSTKPDQAAKHLQESARLECHCAFLRHGLFLRTYFCPSEQFQRRLLQILCDQHFLLLDCSPLQRAMRVLPLLKNNAVIT